jgi:ribose/xylose/arabinose/galactoside ABC-type transport system permease subunit
MEVTMAAIARALSRAFITINEMDVLKQLVLFAATGLFVSLLILSYGVDLSPGFF